MPRASKKKKQRSRLQGAKTTIKVATLAGALGIAIGAVVGLLNAPKSGKELQDDLDKEVRRLMKLMHESRADMRAAAKKIFGEATPEALALYAKAKSEVLARVAKAGGQLSQTKYNAIVDQVIKKVGTRKKLAKEYSKLSKNLKRRWKDIKKARS